MRKFLRRPNSITSCYGLCVAAFVGILLVPQLFGQEENTIDFSRDIKPLLADRCFQCHGPDKNHREADLRLDIANEAFKAAVTAATADKTEILSRITSDDPDTIMPPIDANKKRLTASEIGLIRSWLEQGAKVKSHWAYEKPENPKLPKTSKLAEWTETAIDKFIAQRLETVGHAPSSPADKRTLIRRIYFDLIGLPPSPEKVKAFIDDNSPNAFEKIVDELLNSQAFGERMAVYWLDQVRYADTNGIHGDNHRDHTLYRDYIIDAFNSNMPFDQFTIEQLAGDLLPNRTNQQLIASGYNRLNMTTREGGAQAKEYRAKYAADRVRNASVVWMGSTLGCAECHDHKYDPFKSKDFYRFAAFFADIDETAVGQQKPIQLPTDAQGKELTKINLQIAAAKRELEKRTPKRDESFEQFLLAKKSELKNQKPAWNAIEPIDAKSSGGATLKIADATITSTGENPNKDNYTISYKTKLKKITAFKLDVLTDQSFGNQSLSRGNGNIVLTNVTIEHNGKPIKVASAIADFSQDGHDIKLAIDNKPDSGWAVSGHTKKENHKAVFVFEKAIDVSNDKPIVVKLFHQSIYAKHNIGKFQISLTDVKTPSLDNSSGVPTKVVAAINKDPSERNNADNNVLYRCFLNNSDAVKPQRDSVNRLSQQKQAIEKSFRPILVTKRISPRMTRVLPRGNWLDDSGEVVTPGVPSFLKQIALVEQSNSQKNKPQQKGVQEVANRLDLATWIVDPENPLTARVFVNRLWKIAFGEGLVRTPDDFGSQGSVPTHPELLDYLAIRFIESGWDIKQTLKTIVMTNAYQQASFASDSMLKNDPANELLARQNRFRIDAEFVRDNAMYVSGLLVDKIGGNSVKPYQPAGYWQHLNFPKRTYQANKDQDQYRRGVYSYWCRTFLNPSMSVFDAPSREEACVQRPRSNTPLQALVLLNDPSYVEAAQAFAEKIVRNAKSDSDRLIYAYSTVLNRSPSKLENQLLMKLYNEHKTKFAKNVEEAKASIKIGNRIPPDDLDAIELAAWTSVARTILNLHETITRY